MSGLEKAKSDAVEQFTAQVDRFVTSPHVNQPEPVARYVSTVAPRDDERVLDVGCGPGLLAKAFAPHVREFVGVDLTLPMVAKAADIARAAGIPNAPFEVGDALALPFDLALHHMSDPRPRDPTDGVFISLSRGTGFPKPFSSAAPFLRLLSSLR